MLQETESTSNLVHMRDIYHFMIMNTDTPNTVLFLHRSFDQRLTERTIITMSRLIEWANLKNKLG